MFHDSGQARTISKKDYARLVGPLRERLLQAQFQLAESDFPVVVLFAGVDGAGKGDAVNRLSQWLDIRLLRTHSFGRASGEDANRPTHWRYWRALPPKGSMAFFLSAWYHEPLLDFVHGRSTAATYSEQLDRINSFEKVPTDDGALVIKLWLHLDRESQRQRFEELESDPTTSWRVTANDWRNWQRYEDFVAAAEGLIKQTSSDGAPWHVVDGQCQRYLMHEVGSHISQRIEAHLAARAGKIGQTKPKSGTKKGAMNNAASKDSAQPTVLDQIERVVPPAKQDYRKALRELQARLHKLHVEARSQQVSTVLVFEGWDASGKGSSIRRVTAALDVRRVNVVPIAAPTEDERAQHYLWRFWRHLPSGGEVTIFDRSWYGRVLVERIMGYASEREWRRAYTEIAEFEQQLHDVGTAFARFWLHIDPDEQKARFQARADTAYKRWKLTSEDWRNRERWAEYEQAVHDMVTNTLTPSVPWTLIDANSKHHARLRVLETVCEALERALARTRSAD